MPVVRGCDTLTRRGARRRGRRGSPTARAPGRSRPRSCAARRSRSRAPGKLGGLFATPLVNDPEVAILGLAPHRRGPSSATARSSSAPVGQRLASRSTTGSSTARARPSSGCAVDRAALGEPARPGRASAERRGAARACRSIRGALARPSIRSTTRLSLTSTRDGTSVTLKRSASSGCASTSTRSTRSRSRSLRARWASRLSIRRAGPERGRVEEDEQGTGVVCWHGPGLPVSDLEVRGEGVAPPCSRAVWANLRKARGERPSRLARWVPGTRSGLRGLGAAAGVLLGGLVARALRGSSRRCSASSRALRSASLVDTGTRRSAADRRALGAARRCRRRGRAAPRRHARRPRRAPRARRARRRGARLRPRRSATSRRSRCRSSGCGCARRAARATPGCASSPGTRPEPRSSS